jgi:hypothetical protein
LRLIVKESKRLENVSHDLFGETQRAAIQPSKTAKFEAMQPTFRPDGQFGCAKCGEPAHFGFGVARHKGDYGRWACHQHRETVKYSTPS